MQIIYFCESEEGWALGVLTYQGWSALGIAAQPGEFGSILVKFPKTSV